MGATTALTPPDNYPFPIGQRMTATEFALLPAGPPYPELINNLLKMPPSPEFKHQDVSISLASRMFIHIEDHGLGILLEAPMDVHFDENNVLQPDIMFISKDRMPELLADGKRIKGAPDLVVEILSSNRKSDLEEKMYIYELYDVREYWVVDPKKKFVEIFENVEKEFVSVQKCKGASTAHSKVLTGFSIELNKIFRA
ncbi:MAG: Uma2 family endonuclease [Saprospiraceae bacterium]|nr:Uma2 family endonuclease [Saprospiraceae bacterium]